MHVKKVLIILFLFASLALLYFGDRWLKRVVQPKLSFLRFLLYMAACLALVFAYTFFVVFVISKLFPLPKG